MNRFLAEHRRADPKFPACPRRRSPNAQGQWLMPRNLRYFARRQNRFQPMQRPNGEFAYSWRGNSKLVQQRQHLLKDAWLRRRPDSPGNEQRQPCGRRTRGRGVGPEIRALAEGKTSARVRLIRKRSFWLCFPRTTTQRRRSPAAVVKAA